jgi:Flp pilus assembly protein TadG
MNPRKPVPGRETGQSLVEFALLMPVLVLIIFGLFDLGRAVYAWTAVSNAAREGARLAIVDQRTDGSGTSLAAIEAANQATALGLDATDPAQVRVRYLMPDLSAACPTAAVRCVAELRVQHQWQAITPVIGDVLGPLTLSATTQIPIENSTQ